MRLADKRRRWGKPVRAEQLFDVKGTTAIITGAASGIGLAYAKVLAHADLLDAQGGPGNADLTRSLWYLETERVWLAEQTRRGGPAPPPPQEGLTVDPRDILDGITLLVDKSLVVAERAHVLSRSQPLPPEIPADQARMERAHRELDSGALMRTRQGGTVESSPIPNVPIR